VLCFARLYRAHQLLVEQNTEKTSSFVDASSNNCKPVWAIALEDDSFQAHLNMRLAFQILSPTSMVTVRARTLRCDSQSSPNKMSSTSQGYQSYHFFCGN
jgi:hypothetical protein